MLCIILSVEGGYFYRHSEVIQILLEKNIKLIVLTMNNHNKMINEFIDKEVILVARIIQILNLGCHYYIV